MAKNNDPTLQEIAERAAAIRAGWSAEETWKRMRSDWRGTFMRCDGQRMEMSQTTYSEHIEGQFTQDDEDFEEPD